MPKHRPYLTVVQQVSADSVTNIRGEVQSPSAFLGVFLASGGVLRSLLS